MTDDSVNLTVQVTCALPAELWHWFEDECARQNRTTDNYLAAILQRTREWREAGAQRDSRT